MGIVRDYAVSDLLAVARAGSGWSFDAAGVATEVVAGVPRYDWDPLGLSWRGLLVEPQATNQIVNPRGVGAVAGTPGTVPTGWAASGSGSGITRTIVGVGVENGIPYTDIRWAGTASSAINRDVTLIGATIAAAAQGQTWTGGLYARVVDGTLDGVTVIQILHEYNGSGSSVANTQMTLNSAILTSNLREYFSASTRTFTAATAAFAGMLLRFAFAPGVAADVTLRIGAPQLVQTSKAKHPVLPPTASTGASTKPADDVSLTDITRWFSAAAGTIVLDFMPGQTTADASRGVVSLDDGTANNRIDVYLLASSLAAQLLVVSSGVTTVPGSAVGTAAVLVRNTLRLSWGPAGLFVSLNGAAPLIDAAATRPVTLSRVRLGNMGGASANYLCGWVGPRVAYYPTQYTDVAAPDGFMIRTR